MSIAELFKKTTFETILITKVDVIMFINVKEYIWKINTLQLNKLLRF